jgi:hypothetical protein
MRLQFEQLLDPGHNFHRRNDKDLYRYNHCKSYTFDQFERNFHPDIGLTQEKDRIALKHCQSTGFGNYRLRTKAAHFEDRNRRDQQDIGQNL